MRGNFVKNLFPKSFIEKISQKDMQKILHRYKDKNTLIYNKSQK